MSFVFPVSRLAQTLGDGEWGHRWMNRNPPPNSQDDDSRPVTPDPYSHPSKNAWKCFQFDVRFVHEYKSHLFQHTGV